MVDHGRWMWKVDLVSQCHNQNTSCRAYFYNFVATAIFMTFLSGAQNLRKVNRSLYLILTRNITSYHFKQKITKNQSFCWSCSFEFDVLHSIGGKLSHLLNEIFPKLNSMIELIESLCLSLSQPNLSNLKLFFSPNHWCYLFSILNADKIEPEFSASLNILSDAFLFDGKSSKSLVPLNQKISIWSRRPTKSFEHCQMNFAFLLNQELIWNPVLRHLCKITWRHMHWVSTTLSWKWPRATLSPSFSPFFERNHSFRVKMVSQNFPKRFKSCP